MFWNEAGPIAHASFFGAQGYAHIEKSKRLKLDKKAFRCMFLGYSHEVKGYRVWNFDSNRLEFTRSVTLQELPKSKNVQVIGDIPATIRVNYDDDDDTDVVQLPAISTQSDVEPMVVDQTGTDQVISPPSDFESLTPRQDFVHVPDPAFDIDDIHMEQSDLDVDTTRAIVSRGDLVEFPDYLVVQSSQYGGQNAPLALAP